MLYQSQCVIPNPNTPNMLYKTQYVIRNPKCYTKPCMYTKPKILHQTQYVIPNPICHIKPNMLYQTQYVIPNPTCYTKPNMYTKPIMFTEGSWITEEGRKAGIGGARERTIVAAPIVFGIRLDTCKDTSRGKTTIASISCYPERLSLTQCLTVSDTVAIEVLQGCITLSRLIPDVTDAPVAQWPVVLRSSSCRPRDVIRDPSSTSTPNDSREIWVTFSTVRRMSRTKSHGSVILIR